MFSSSFYFIIVSIPLSELSYLLVFYYEVLNVCFWSYTFSKETPFTKPSVQCCHFFSLQYFSTDPILALLSYSFLNGILSIQIWCLTKNTGAITLLLLHVSWCGLLGAADKMQVPGKPLLDLGISAEAFFSTPHNLLLWYSKRYITWKTTKELLSELWRGQQYFTYWSCIFRALCCQGFPSTFC